MASTFTTLMQFEQPNLGGHEDTWGTILNTNFKYIEEAIGGRHAQTITTVDITLDDTSGANNESRFMFIDLTGGITGARSLIVPTRAKIYIVRNSTTGGTSITVKTVSGSGILVERDKTLLLICDGTNVIEANAEPPGDVARATAATLADDSTLFGALAVGIFGRLATSSSWTSGQAVTSVSLTDAANIATNAALGNYFRVTLAGNRTLDNPTNMKDGQGLVFKILQDATGSRTLAYGTKFKWPGGTAPVLTTAASSTDVISGVYDSTDDEILCSFSLDEK